MLQSTRHFNSPPFCRVRQGTGRSHGWNPSCRKPNPCEIHPEALHGCLTSLIDMAVRKCQASIGPLVFLMLTFRMSPFLMPSLCQKCQDIWERGRTWGCFQKRMAQPKDGLVQKCWRLQNDHCTWTTRFRFRQIHKFLAQVWMAGGPNLDIYDSAVSIGPIGKAN